ncbi:MAG TPA: chemotaxis protein CheD [Terriglobales bacterium]|nr:chemotaxis protein CheD [Terriglobales bacterium]
MKSEHQEIPSVRLPMGGVFASNTPTLVSTLLGSCVATCMFDPIAGIGGMNHILLPGRIEPRDDDLATRYGVNAMELLINRIMKLGGRKESLRAKVFGGATMLRFSTGVMNVGELNSSFTLTFLEREGITVDAYRLGGTRAVTVRFYTRTGKATVHEVPRDETAKLLSREEVCEARIYRASRKVNASGIDLF